ncbi:MAG: DUF6445 family protein [Paraglaciecola sp.]|uniref:DUF6445 family protein n=1 Tax=Paraglaciecola sp. TaxID=1920173 RepID=UPI00273DC484|nr:DUF6445 family protein [Paraglaciecola sp.]MDP5032785.1 DUF6445 family protein [Paraglaciecola sp.]MDP5130589.1 DUF6445 family protein [Paraglaciecola sp.]
MHSYTVHPQSTVTTINVGEEQNPLFIIDNWLLNADLLLETASQASAPIPTKQHFYPGQQFLAPTPYSAFVCDFLQRKILPLLADSQALQFKDAQSIFSWVSVRATDLLPIQRIPHIDTHKSTQWAVVHYLCGEQSGGTGFFRHRASGFESINVDRQKRYTRVLEDEAQTLGVPAAQYLQGSTRQFELIYQVPAQLNRAIIYPSNLLHSGLIKRWISEDGQLSRLTVNSFVQLSPTSPFLIP